MSEPGEETRGRLLDAAERLFAAGGFAGTSLRAVTAEAGVNVAAAHYHFGSKGELLRAVFARRVAPINEERLKRLDALEGRPGASPDLDEILAAMLGPALAFAERHPELCELTGLLYSEPAEELKALLEEVFGEVSRRFTAALVRALPALPRDVLETRFDFAVGAMVHVIAKTRTQERSPGALLPELAAFLAAGMRASVSSPGAPTRGSP